jgi:hypothetical protein
MTDLYIFGVLFGSPILLLVVFLEDRLTASGMN